MKNPILKIIILLFISLHVSFAQTTTDSETQKTPPQPKETKTVIKTNETKTSINIPLPETIGAIKDMFGTVKAERSVSSKPKISCKFCVCFQNNSTTTIEVFLVNKQETAKNKLVIQPKGEGYFYQDAKTDIIYKFSAFDNADKTLKTESEIKLTNKPVIIPIQ